MKLIDKAKQAAVESAVTKALEYLEKDPETNIPKLMELCESITRSWYKSQRDAIRNAIQDTDSNWYKLIMNLYQLDPGVRKVFFQNFIVNASLKGSARQEEGCCTEQLQCSRGQSFWILQVPVICIAQDAGQQSMVTS